MTVDFSYAADLCEGAGRRCGREGCLDPREGVRAKLVDRGNQNELPVADQRDAVGDVLHLRQDVGGDEDGGAGCARVGDKRVEPLLDQRFSPAVGSSSTSRSGSCMNACTRPTLWRLPLESEPIGRRAAAQPAAYSGPAEPAEATQMCEVG